MDTAIQAYNNTLFAEDKSICDLLMHEITKGLPKAEHKIRHAHPVWFLDGNPIVGYSKQKKGICVLFWSGQSFDETDLEVNGTFKAAQIFYTHIDQIHTTDLQRWLTKSISIQWDYKNIVKRRGVLERLT